MSWGGVIFAVGAIGAMGYVIYHAPPPPANTAVDVITDNPSVNVTKLFSHDGCTGYKATGRGMSQEIYYVRCEDSTVNTNWNTTSTMGKGIKTNNHIVETVSK